MTRRGRRAISKSFASTADTQEKAGTLEELAPGVLAFTAQGDPNVGAIVGPESVLCVDARATPTGAQEWLTALREVTGKPVEWLLLTHYHAVRTLGAAAFDARHVVAHDATGAWIAERGAADFESELRRFPRLFRNVESVPGLTRPDVTFPDRLTLWMGDRELQLIWLGRGHTFGDACVWLPQERVLFAGDLVEARAAPYMGDAAIQEWSTTTLDRVKALRPEALVPGRGPAVRGGEVDRTIEDTRAYLCMLWEAVARVHQRGGDLRAAFDEARAALEPRFGDWWIFEHCLPFNAARAYDEAQGLDPQVWTAEKDAAVWDDLQR